MLVEVKYPKNKIEYLDEECPNCKTKTLTKGQIPCPDNKPGCLVYHFGITCNKCGKIYNKTSE